MEATILGPTLEILGPTLAMEVDITLVPTMAMEAGTQDLILVTTLGQILEMVAGILVLMEATILEMGVGILAPTLEMGEAITQAPTMEMVAGILVLTMEMEAGILVLTMEMGAGTLVQIMEMEDGTLDDDETEFKSVINCLLFCYSYLMNISKTFYQIPSLVCHSQAHRFSSVIVTSFVARHQFVSEFLVRTGSMNDTGSRFRHQGEWWWWWLVR